LLASVTFVFQERGYILSETAEFEAGFEKVALFGDPTGVCRHVARQLATGWWTSKLGSEHDIEHRSLSVLEGADYGKVAVVLKRAMR
jgi:hypothetical protein